jgi:hypothetical protein
MFGLPKTDTEESENVITKGRENTGALPNPI